MVARLIRVIAAALALYSGSQMAFAGWVVTVNSQVMTNGVFVYDTTMDFDPIVSNMDMLSAQVAFAARTAYVSTPADFIASTNDPNVAQWDHDGPVASSIDSRFVVQSAYTNYQLDSLTHTFIFTFEHCEDGHPAMSINMGGFVKLEALVPALEQTPALPSAMSSTYAIIPHMAIASLGDHSIRIDWNNDATVALEGSDKLGSWSNVANFFISPPSTVWTSTASLFAGARFYRIRLLALCHDTNEVDALTEADIAWPLTTGVRNLPGVRSIEARANSMEVEADTVSGVTYDAFWTTSEGKRVGPPYRFAATQSITRVEMPLADVGVGAYFLEMLPQ